MFGEVDQGLGPWGAGGPGTARPFDPKVKPINSRKAVNFGSPHAGGAYFVTADGRVRFISETIDPKIFRALVTARGNEAIGEDWELTIDD